MKWLENNIWLRQLGYILHDYIYRPIKLFQYKYTWKLHGNELSIYNRTLNKPRVLYISLINGGGLKKHLGDQLKVCEMNMMYGFFMMIIYCGTGKVVNGR